MTLTGGSLVAREVQPALSLSGGTWHVTGAGAALGPFTLEAGGTLLLDLPAPGAVALSLSQAGTLAGTLTVALAGQEPAYSGTYTLVVAPSLETETLVVDASGLDATETSWEVVSREDGGRAIVLSVSGEDRPASDEDAGSAPGDAAGVDTDGVGPSLDAALGEDGGSGGCGGGLAAPWLWWLSLVGLVAIVVIRRRRVQRPRRCVWVESRP